MSRLDLGPACVCSHGEAAHDIRKNGTRSACSVSTGPRGAACPCKSYEPKEGDE